MIHFVCMYLLFISNLLTAQNCELIHYHLGQTIYHDNKAFVITAYENNQLPVAHQKEYIETTITAERPVTLFGIEFAKEILHKTISQGKKPNADTIIISENAEITRSYALKSYIIATVFIYSLAKSLLAEMYPSTYIINRN